MNMHAASTRTDRATLAQRTSCTDLCGKMHRSPWLKGHFLLVGATNPLSLPIQEKGSLGKAVAIAHWPAFAIDRQIGTTLAHHYATEIGPINMQFAQHHLLAGQVSHNGLGDARFWGVGSSDADRPHQSAIQIVQDMAFVAIDAHAATLASMPHLGIFDADAPLLGHAFAQGGFAI